MLIRIATGITQLTLIGWTATLLEAFVTKPTLLDQPPASDQVTDYDLAHRITYLRLLDADADGADWREVARIVLGLDPDQEKERARRIHASHLVRAKWMTEAGYRDLLERDDR